MLPQHWTTPEKHFANGRQPVTQGEAVVNRYYAISNKRFAKYLGKSGKSFRVCPQDGWNFHGNEITVRKLWTLADGDEQRIDLYEKKFFATHHKVALAAPSLPYGDYAGLSWDKMHEFSQDKLFRLLRGDEIQSIYNVNGIYPKDVLKYMEPQAHVRKTKARTPAFSNTLNAVVALALSQSERHEADRVVTIAEFPPSQVEGYVRLATDLIDKHSAIQPYNFASALQEALVYGSVSRSAVTFYQFDREELFDSLPKNFLICKGVRKYVSSLNDSHLDEIADLMETARIVDDD